jgi:hypothetical protein
MGTTYTMSDELAFKKRTKKKGTTRARAQVCCGAVVPFGWWVELVFPQLTPCSFAKVGEPSFTSDFV